jgi:type IV pilus assembly protein PilM
MPKSQTAVGIDIGSHALKAVVLRKTGTHVSLVRAGAVELGELAFLDDSERKDSRVAELLRVLLRRSRIPRRTGAVGLAGRDYFVKYLHVPPTTRDKLRKLIEYDAAEDPAAAAKEQTSDFWLLDLPSKPDEFTVLVVLARNETLLRRLAFLKSAGVRAEGLTLNALALFNAYVQAMDEAIFNDKTTLLVDIGARNLDVVVQRNAKLIFVRNLTLGGGRFTEGVQEEFRLPIREAEELKISRGAILPTHFDVAAEIDTSTPEARLSAALLEPGEAIYDTLQASIKYCQAQTRMANLKIDEVVLSGRGARLRGLREFLAQRFRVPVEVLDPLRTIETSALPPAERDEVAENASSYAVAIGLALRELEERHLRPISLLLESLRRQREFYNRDVFLYLAAAVLLAAFATMFYSSSLATSKAEEEFGIKSKLAADAEGIKKQLDAQLGENGRLADQNTELRRLFDTPRRCAEVLAVLKETTPQELSIDSISTITDRPTPLVAKTRPAAPQEATTTLVIEGRVVEKPDAKDADIAAALRSVDSFLHDLEKQKHLYRQAKITKYPDPNKEVPGQRTFRMIVTFAAPFEGG